MTKRYELRVNLEIDESVDLELFKALLSKWVHRSPKLRIHWIKLNEVLTPGRPAEVKQEIYDYLLTQSKPRSAAQISRKILRAQQSCYRPLHTLKEEGLLVATKDPRWRVMRYQVVSQGEDNE